MNRQIVFDSDNDRLIFLMNAPSQDYWGGLWRPLLTAEGIARGNRFVTKETKRVLHADARIVDAGCGIGATVYGLSRAGFDAHGIDYSEETVNAIRAFHPHLHIDVADVRNMPFDDGSLDGVWSLGVIEHFFDGFDAVIDESYRVLRPGGYLFLTVPVISPLKSLLIRLRCYPDFDPVDRNHFFQFAFRKNFIVRQITSRGFVFERSCKQSGSFGLSEDLPTLANIIFPKIDGQSLPARIWWRFLDILLTPLSHHIRFFRFRKIL